MPTRRRAIATLEDAAAAIRELQDAVARLEKPDSQTIKRDPNSTITTDRLRLVNAAITKIPHGLGRAYQEVRTVSLVPVASGAAGHVEEVLVDAAGVPVDPKREVWVRLIGLAGGNADVRLKVS